MILISSGSKGNLFNDNDYLVVKPFFSIAGLP